MNCLLFFYNSFSTKFIFNYTFLIFCNFSKFKFQINKRLPIISISLLIILVSFEVLCFSSSIFSFYFYHIAPYNPKYILDMSIHFVESIQIIQFIAMNPFFKSDSFLIQPSKFTRWMHILEHLQSVNIFLVLSIQN